MATRLYLPSTGSTGIPTLNPSASWNVTTGFDRIWAVATKISSAMTDKQSGSPGGSTNQSVLNRQYVYGPIGAQTISGTIAGQVRGKESHASLDAVSAITIRVVAPGGTVRGTLLALTYPALSGNEYTTTTTNRYTPVSGNLTQVTAQQGDYILIEIGGFCYASSNSRTVTQSFGDDAGVDLPVDQTDTNTKDPWVEFSGSITMYYPDRSASSIKPLGLGGSSSGWVHVTGSTVKALGLAGAITAAVDIAASSSAALGLGGSASGTVQAGSAIGYLVGSGPAYQISTTGPATAYFVDGTGDEVIIDPLASSGYGIQVNTITGEATLTPPAATISASSIKALGLTGSISGKVAIAASSSKSLGLSGSASSTVLVSCSSVKTLGLGGSSTAKIGTTASSVKSLGLGGSASGTVLVTCSSTQSLGLGGSAAGIVISGRSASSIQPLGLSGSAAGIVLVSAASTQSLGLSGSITGTVLVSGSSVAPLGLSGSISGTVEFLGIQCSSIQGLGLSGNATATVDINASTIKSLTIGGLANGVVAIDCSSIQELGLDGSASGVVQNSGELYSIQPLGLSGSASATVLVTGSSVQSLGLSGSASGSIGETERRVSTEAAYVVNSSWNDRVSTIAAYVIRGNEDRKVSTVAGYVVRPEPNQPHKPILTLFGVGVDSAAVQSSLYFHPYSVAAAGAQFQIVEADGSFETPLETRDTDWDADGLWRTQLFDNLNPGSIYKARVRHRDVNAVWSEWSDELLIYVNGTSVTPNPVTIGAVTYKERFWDLLGAVEIGTVRSETVVFTLWEYGGWHGADSDDARFYLVSNNPGNDMIILTREGHHVWDPIEQVYHDSITDELVTPVAGDVWPKLPWAPVIIQPDSSVIYNENSITITWRPLTGRWPEGAVVDIEYSNGVSWHSVFTDVAPLPWLIWNEELQEWEWHLENTVNSYDWDISDLPPGNYQLRIRMRWPDSPDPEYENSRWRYGYVFYRGPISGLFETSTSIADWTVGYRDPKQDWSSGLNSVINDYDNTVITDGHYLTHTATGQPRSVEICALIKDWCIGEAMWNWRFNAYRVRGVAAIASGTADNQYGFAAVISVGSEGPIADDNMGYNAPDDMWRSSLLYERGDGATLRLIKYTGADPKVGELVADADLGFMYTSQGEHSNPVYPYYQVRMRIEQLVEHEDGSSDYRVRVQVCGPEVEPTGADYWQIDETVTNVTLPDGGVGPMGWMENYLNYDVGINWAAVKILYGIPLDLEFDSLCGDLTITGLDDLGREPQNVLSATLVITDVDTQQVMVDSTQNSTRWYWTAEQAEFLAGLNLEATIVWTNTAGQTSPVSEPEAFTFEPLADLGEVSIMEPKDGQVFSAEDTLQLSWALITENNIPPAVAPKYDVYVTFDGIRRKIATDITQTYLAIDLSRYGTGDLYIQIDVKDNCTRHLARVTVKIEESKDLCWPIPELRIGTLNTVGDLATAHTETVDKLNELIRCFNSNMQSIHNELYPDDQVDRQ